MNTYEEKKQARIERYEELSQRNRANAAELLNSSSRKAVIDMAGEPIKVGHHSEGKHRRLLERAENDSRKAYEACQKADYYKEKAEATRKNTAISSDDPEAIVKLKEKLEKLTSYQNAMKKANAEARKNKTDKPFMAYQLTNNNANIKTVKNRIEKLESVKALENKYLFENEEVKIYLNADINRLQLLYDGKPDDDTRTNLKRWGFRWSPSNMAWQRQITNSAMYAAKQLYSF